MGAVFAVVSNGAYIGSEGSAGIHSPGLAGLVGSLPSKGSGSSSILTLPQQVASNSADAASSSTTHQNSNSGSAASDDEMRYRGFVVSPM